MVELEYGQILYEKSNAQSLYDAPKGKVGGREYAKRIYIILLGFGLLSWFIYSLIIATNKDGFQTALINHIFALVILLIAELILILTAFNAWGKFARLILPYRSLRRNRRIKGVKINALENEINYADENKEKEDAIRIYKDYVVITNLGEDTIIDRLSIQNVQCVTVSTGYNLVITKVDGVQITASTVLKMVDLPLIKKHFNSFTYDSPVREKGYILKKFPLLGMAFIPLVIGIVLMLLHFLVLNEMPLVFGVLFLAFGIVFITAQFSDITYIHHGVMPILGGLLIMALPLSVLLTLMDLLELSSNTILSNFTAIHAVLSLFFGFGPMLIILGIAGIIDCYRFKK